MALADEGDEPGKRGTTRQVRSLMDDVEDYRKEFDH